MLQRNYFF